MRRRVDIAIWGPAHGSELEVATRAGEAEIEARACALRGLRARLHDANITASAVARETRVEAGRALPGYRITLTVVASTPSWRPADDVVGLGLWVESVVSVALLELLNPMRVDGVRAL